MNERDEWVRVGKLSKSLILDLHSLKNSSNDLVSFKTKKHLKEALDEINGFRNKAENEMLLSGIGELGIFYGEKEPVETFKKFLQENDVQGIEEQRISATVLYNHYLDWSNENNFKYMTKTSFGIEASKRFKKIKNSGIYYLVGGKEEWKKSISRMKYV